LEAAVIAGLASAGVDVITLGVLPTPAVAFLTDALGADLGVMLSASHNPMPDNGIKFFARGGHKLDDAIEDQIEARLGEPWDRPVGNAVGRITRNEDAVQQYAEHLLAGLPHPLTGLTVVVDCANGAASFIAPEVLRRAGATVIAIHAAPDGININDNCGSTHLDDLIAAVREHGADVGIAHDGDADRCLAVDATGAVVNGDHILAILALGMRERRVLVRDTVVTTVMANLGFRLAMQAVGITVVETAVGDRYVLEAMRAAGFNLGGEQSGHVILSEFGTTGDGVLTALHLLAQVAETGMPLAELSAVVDTLPQVLINVSGVDRLTAAGHPDVVAAVQAAEAELGDGGRVLLRPSGTEPVVRVMVEAQTMEQATRIAQMLTDALQATASAAQNASTGSPVSPA
jgi:phosphoglucosamine mutase